MICTKNAILSENYSRISAALYIKQKKIPFDFIFVSITLNFDRDQIEN